MSVYDINGEKIDSEISPWLNEPFLSTSKIHRLRKDSSFDVSGFSLTYEFSPFSTNYSTGTNTPRVLNISQAEFYATFYDKYLGVHDGLVVTKKNLGKDQSGLYDVWCYDFKPYTAKKKVLLSSAMHTYELPASFGLARWVQELMESTDEVFEYLRENVYFSIIPIVNPWGFNQNPKTYGNVKGVNPARNFDNWAHAWDDFPVYTPAQNEWNVKGDSPFSEAEVKNLAMWMKNNTDADFYIDCHTGLGCTRSAYGDVWCIYLSENPLATNIINAANALGNRITTKYGRTAKMHIITDTADVINQRYCLQVIGIPCVTIEQAQGNDTVYTTVPNNASAAITEYATQVHAFVISLLRGVS
jgi:predicted deacylase